MISEGEFSPNCEASIQYKGGLIECAAEDWGTPLVIMYYGTDEQDYYWAVSKRYHRPIASYTSVKVARNFVRRFYDEFPAYDEVVERVLSGRYSIADTDYLYLAEQRKKHVTYKLPEGLEMLLRHKI